MKLVDWRSCPRCRALYDPKLGVCPECGQSFAYTKARREGGIFDRLAARNIGVTMILLAANILVFVACLLLQKSAPRGGGSFVTSILPVSGNTIADMGGLTYDGVVDDGEWWRLVCAMFLHFSLLHIGFNLYALRMTGPALEQMIGPAKFLALYFLSGIGGSVASIVSHGEGFWIGAGASGAICGTVGMLIAWAIRTKNAELKHMMVRWVLIILVMGVAFHFDNAAHVGGLVIGAATAWFVKPATLTRLSPRAVGVWDAAAVLSLLAVVASFALAVTTNIERLT